MVIPIDKPGIPANTMSNDFLLSSAALHKLTQWLSPSFPVGGYAYSHGLEWAVKAGDVHDAATAQGWIFDLLRHGSGRNDAILLAHAYGAKNDAELAQVCELAAAFVASAERGQETMEMGAALAKAISGVWGKAEDDAPYPVVLGAAARGHDIPLAPSVAMYLHSFGANLVSAAQRLVPLGQVEGQTIVANMAQVIEQLMPEILAASLDDLGGCAFRGDMASMQHETQNVRLFRT